MIMSWAWPIGMRLGPAGSLASGVANVSLAYLQSYEHMGRALVSCSGSCACADSEIDAHTAPSPDRVRVSITAVRRIALRLLAPAQGASSFPANRSGSGIRADAEGGSPRCCRLTVRILQATSSGEHKFKVSALLLALASESDNWQPPGTKVNPGTTLDMMHRAYADVVAAPREHRNASGQSHQLRARVAPARGRRPSKVKAPKAKGVGRRRATAHHAHAHA